MATTARLVGASAAVASVLRTPRIEMRSELSSDDDIQYKKKESYEINKPESTQPDSGFTNKSNNIINNQSNNSAASHVDAHVDSDSDDNVDDGATADNNDSSDADGSNFIEVNKTNMADILRSDTDKLRKFSTRSDIDITMEDGTMLDDF